MVYLYSVVIAVSAFLLEISFLPHFSPYLITPFLLLPFISILSLKDRTIFPLILAGIMGILTDATTGSGIPIFLIAYLSVVLVSKLFMDKFTSYGENRANIISVGLGIVIIYLLGIISQFQEFSTISMSWVIPLSVNIILTYLSLVVYSIFGHKYFAWVEKETEGRFR